MKIDQATLAYPFKNLLKLATRYGWGGADAELRGALLEIRRTIARLWLATPIEGLESAYAGRLGESHRLVRGLDLRALPLGPEDAALLVDIQRGFPAGAAPAETVRQVLASMLFADAHELPLMRELDAVPEWFQKDYLGYLFQSPALFKRPGEADRYCEYMDELVTLLHAGILSNRGSSRWQERADGFMKLSFMLTYFNEKNLSALYKKRADILEQLLYINKLPINHQFPRRDPRREKIKLGLLAAHFGPQTETYFTIAGLEGLDREQFKIILYAPAAQNHYLEEFCKSLCDEFVLLPKGHTSLQAARIRADDLDVLLIASNVTAVIGTVTLLTLGRLARIQVVQGACPVTSGMRHVDYFLSARWNEPETGAATHYAETLFLMDESINYYAYQHDRDTRSLVINRAALGIPDGAVVFCSGANFYKIVPELAATWAKVMAQVPDSELILYPFNPNWRKEYPSEAFQLRLTADLAAHGVNIKRVHILPKQPARADIHEIVKLADVYLDSHPFPGVCSLYDPLSLACPVVTWRGTTMRSLHSTAMLRQLDADDLAAVDEPDYIAKAVRLALDPPARAAVRERLRARMANGNPFEDSRRFSAKVGAALRSMFEAYRDSRETWVQKSAPELKTEAQRLADAARGNLFYEGLTDIELARSLIKPYFQWLDDLPAEPRMVDVGACHGHLAVFFLAMGWQTEMFEPDPAALTGLHKFAAAYGARARIFPFAVSDRAAGAVEFHQSLVTGLSGLGVSPYGGDELLIRVRCVRLGDFLNEQGVKHVEFLKIDAEGWDFTALESHDFEGLPPRIVMVEFGAGQGEWSLAEVKQGVVRMAERGYDAVTFEYDDDGKFKQGLWEYRLINIYIDRPFEPSHERSFGNIVFYRQGDRAFPATLIAMLESFRDTRQGK